MGKRVSGDVDGTRVDSMHRITPMPQSAKNGVLILDENGQPLFHRGIGKKKARAILAFFHDGISEALKKMHRI